MRILAQITTLGHESMVPGMINSDGAVVCCRECALFRMYIGPPVYIQSHPGEAMAENNPDPRHFETFAEALTFVQNWNQNLGQGTVYAYIGGFGDTTVYFGCRDNN